MIYGFEIVETSLWFANSIKFIEFEELNKIRVESHVYHI